MMKIRKIQTTVNDPLKATPIIGECSLYNLLNNQLLEYRKQGGKMNILEFLKKGSGIHIKKENRGKFTDYCGGKVTSACITKGKKSPNAAIRKRATFADNARHFKHRSGGLIIKAKLGSNINWNNIALTGLDLYNGISLLSSLNKAKNNYFEAQNNNIKLKVNEAIANYDTNQFVLQQMGLLNSLGDNGGLIVEQLYRKLAEDMIRNKVENTAKIEALNDKNKFMYQYNDLLLLILGLLLNSGMSILGNFKKSSNGAPTSTLS